MLYWKPWARPTNLSLSLAVCRRCWRRRTSGATRRPSQTSPPASRRSRWASCRTSSPPRSPSQGSRRRAIRPPLSAASLRCFHRSSKARRPCLPCPLQQWLCRLSPFGFSFRNMMMIMIKLICTCIPKAVLVLLEGFFYTFSTRASKLHRDHRNGGFCMDTWFSMGYDEEIIKRTFTFFIFLFR